MSNINIPQGAQIIIHTLQQAGYDAYVVGGCVRDSLLGVEPKDWDVCTSASPSQILYSFCDKRVAVKQKTNQFIKPVDRGIGLRVYDLLKIREAEDVAFAVYRTASNINI